MPARAFGPTLKHEWCLDPRITYLNHGTVGAPPRRVLAHQQAIRDEIERQPAAFLLRGLSNASFVGGTRPAVPRMRAAAAAVAAFLGARGDDLVFVDNASAGANAVLRSLTFAPGDEIVLTSHGYGAILQAARFVARRAGAVVRLVDVPYPAFDAGRLVELLAAQLGPRTRLVVVDHVTAESALVLPVADIARRCHDAGVPVLVDGAHVPGALALDIPSLGVDWYAANLHKWAFSPRSAGVLWAAPDRQADLHPPVISWGLDQGFTEAFDWVGTRDPSPWLAAPAGLEFLDELGFAQVRAWNHDLAWRAGQLLADRWGTAVPVPESVIGTMVTVPVPARLGTTPADAARLRDRLLLEHGIEVQVHAAAGAVWTRVSAQVYCDLSDVARLADAVADA
ncbi:MAG: aminotransferase class V-fold PLP-dependent enzyme [Vicinamibacterales bacterium]